MNRKYSLVIVAAVAIGLAACGKQSAEEPVAEVETVEAETLEAVAPPVLDSNCPIADENGSIEIADGLTARIIQKGYGRAAVNGDYAGTNVWLWLYDESAEDRHGEFIWESGANAFQFQLGAGQVIKGWDLGVPCMIEGETRELLIAGDLAYGPSGRGNIPPNATLIFTIELLKLTAPE